MSKCIISGCESEAKHNLGVRLRRPDTSAIWSPNTEAYLCDRHATLGLKITIILESTKTQEIETKVIGFDQEAAKRSTQINRGA